LISFQVVNNFLNNFLSFASPAQDALNALPFAIDESNQPAVLQADLNAADSNDLLNFQFLTRNFSTVVAALPAIANDGGNQDVVRPTLL